MEPKSLSYFIKSFSESGDQRAFEMLYRHFYPGLLSYANSFVKNESAAEELVEDVFIKLWENRNIVPTINNLSHYLYVAAKHKCINYLKSKKNIPSVEIGDDAAFTFATPESRLVCDENLKVILDAINSLPPQCKLIFRLTKEEGLKYREVAQLLDISPRTVNAQLTLAFSRVVKKLREKLPEFSMYFSQKK